MLKRYTGVWQMESIGSDPLLSIHPSSLPVFISCGVRSGDKVEVIEVCGAEIKIFCKRNKLFSWIGWELN
jgi:hypothetical protein